MAFPLAPAVGDRHIEAGVPYIWTVTSWDVDTTGQVLVENAADPVNGVDTADIHTVWRSTVDGSAWQYEEYIPTGPLIGASTPLVTTGAFSTSGTSPILGLRTTGTTWRQSFTLTNYSTINSINHRFGLGVVTGTIPAGTITARIYSGANTTSGVEVAAGSLGLGSAIITSNAVTPSTTGAVSGISFDHTFTFPLPVLLAPGTYSVVFTATLNTTYTVPAKANTVTGSFGNNVGDTRDLNFTVSGVKASGGVWVPIVQDCDIQFSAAAPITQSGGQSLIPGDLWIVDGGANDEVLFYWDGANWVAIKTFYDNSIQGFLLADDQQQAILELDTYVDWLEAGTQFVGSYNTTTNFANFTTASGFTDGALPAASTVPNTFVISTTQGTGTGNAPAVPINKGDFIVSDGTSWTVIPVGTAVDEFPDYLDTPNSYVGQAGKALYVNATETAVEFLTQTDTHTILTDAQPATRVNGAALTAGDGWQEITMGREHFYDGAAWQEQVYVEVTAGTAPAPVYSGKLWYDTNTGTLYVYDSTATKYVAI